MSYKYEYKGFYYDYEIEVEEDNRKILHDVSVIENGKLKYFCHYPLSPYSHCTRELFERWIDMGMPSRFEMGGHHRENHEKYYDKWLNEQVDKVLLDET